MSEDISEFMKRSAYSSQLIMSALLINDDWCFAIVASNLLYERQGRRTIREEDTTAAQVTTITIEEKFFLFWVDEEINQLAKSVTKSFCQSNVEQEPRSTHNEDESCSMDA